MTLQFPERILCFLIAACLLPGVAHAYMQPLEDSELSQIEGQAFFQTDKMVGTGTTATGTNNITFYKIGLDTQFDFNMNIKEMELGRTNTGVDLWGRDVAFGCAANAAGTCVDSSLATQLRQFSLKRPFLQIAVANDGAKASREVIGIRIGAENVNGPLSFGQLLSFSGYMSATANFTMQAQTDVAVTCGPSTGPCVGSASHSTGINSFGYNAPNQSLDMDNFSITGCVLIIICLTDQARNYTVNINSASQSGKVVTASGSRLTQAIINDIDFDTLINSITGSMTLNQSNGINENLVSLVIGQVRSQANTQVKNQFRAALQIGGGGQLPGCASLASCDLPYNLGNVHQVLINSPDFGLSFQKQALSYPGYVAAMNTGWSMYLPNAFTLNVVRPASNFTSNITNGNAYNGNIINLPPVYDNCWGAATFC
ncbi:MAG: hypothetical protein ACOY3X_01615 [Pseudomonadota bacterium]